jgi:aromatic-amino-acid transaminase
MLAAIAALPSGSIVLLHACCHNPTGVDLTRDQWRDLIPVIARARLLPFVDMAYQGFGDGIAEDASRCALLADAGVSFFWSPTRSPRASRCTASAVRRLSVVCPTPPGAIACWAS